ncbi:MAG TPA: V-type ATP synthase subunit A [Spirochaetota bacterium]|jgi:V/A-type H+-transporting ATPase subunit A|nr:MAG: V-type ATP synthase alpha chain [Spirochaetes bacterium ADurb.Bin133]HNZ27769.1 V-type ATP synthase subunit A [Spirochaetota bacterium]HOF01263.1 V-type ATP synthase subunit A [Spirochaetota bacterium]HOS33462.1 V-type ATP synthase subunit A [Spirochaetota bacterium]HOS56250.1 V-type ATP synthase subunit A [Spirochaetota bacterium]
MSDVVKGIVVDIDGPIVKAINMNTAGMLDVVYVGEKSLVGEIIKLDRGKATIQIYEENSMMGIGDEVVSHKRPLSVLLGPGLLEGIYDGIQRPLMELSRTGGNFLLPGVKADPISFDKKWKFVPIAKKGDLVSAGTKIGYVDETALVRHFIMIPPDTKSGKIDYISGEEDKTVLETVAKLDNGAEIKMAHYWSVRKPRPYKERLSMNRPLITGQRVIDMFFPIARGGTAAIPGGFGTGKTMTQHALAKWSDADIIVYIGCGERGNEMTDVLNEFPHLIDPKSKQPLMKRTILIANTSNMPVAAREVSIYTGVTIAEYFRDMGYNVAIMADSTSRWAEALRELSGRLEEMPAEEGFPAYLPTRLAEFYERAGLIRTANDEEGSISIIGAVSPPGGDFSEPVTQHTKRFIRCFWALDKSLANARHYPSISWLDSYSEYNDEIKEYWNGVDADILNVRAEAMTILKREERLAQIVKLVGPDSLPDSQRLILLVADLLKKGYLQQSAFDEVDMYSTPKKQSLLLKVIMNFYWSSENTLKLGTPLIKIRELGLVDEIAKLKSTVSNDNTEELENYIFKIKDKFDELMKFYKV